MVALPREKDSAPRAGRWRRSLLLLVVAVAALVAAGLLLRMYSERSRWSSVATAIGNYRRSSLADGSTLELNTNTEVRYRLSDKVRLLELTTGEARFRVAHEIGRPFVVLANDTIVRAVGTEFTVRIRANGRVEVVVAEGVVAVSHHERQGVLGELLHGRVVPLEGGAAVPEKRIAMDDGGRLAVVEMSRTKIEAHDAWRNNLLIFEDVPLRDIAEEFNRYDRRKLEIADPAIANVLLGGRYRPRDVEGFLQNLGAVMKIRVVEVRSDSGDGVVLRIYGDKAKQHGPAR